MENFEKLNRLELTSIVNLKQSKGMETTTQIQEEIDALAAQLTGDMFQDVELKDKIHNLEMKMKGVKPMDSHFDCVGCGS